MFDKWKMFAHGARALGIGALSVAGVAVTAWLADPVAMTAALEDVSPAVVVAVVPVINALGEMLRNAVKHW
jgi:hypothetical protein